MNAKRERTGTLWEGRFYSGLVPSEYYALACYRYIELNPVRAAMVTTPEQYRWSSHRANVQDHGGTLLRPHPAYLALGSDATYRATAYRELCDTSLPSEAVNEIRRATRSGHRMGTPRKPRGRPKRSDAQINGDCHQLEMVTVTN